MITYPPGHYTVEYSDDMRLTAETVMGNVKDKFYYNGSDIYGSYGNYADIGSEWLHENYYHQCEFPDTGLAKSWCKKCAAEGLYSFQLGKYIKQEEKT